MYSWLEQSVVQSADKATNSCLVVAVQCVASSRVHVIVIAVGASKRVLVVLVVVDVDDQFVEVLSEMITVHVTLSSSTCLYCVHVYNCTTMHFTVYTCTIIQSIYCVHVYNCTTTLLCTRVQLYNYALYCVHVYNTINLLCTRVQ